MFTLLSCGIATLWLNLPLVARHSIAAPSGWEIEEKLKFGLKSVVLRSAGENDPNKDQGWCSQPDPPQDNDPNYGDSYACNGFILYSYMKRPTSSSASENGWAAGDVKSYQVKWTWMPGGMPIPTSVENKWTSKVAKISGVSPSESSMMSPPGAMSATNKTTAKTYGQNPTLMESVTETEEISANGFYSFARAHIVSYITGAGQHFTSEAIFSWLEEL